MATVSATGSTPVPAARWRARRPGRGALALGVLAAWVVAWWPLRGRDTLSLPTSDLTPAHDRLNELRDWVDAHRADNAFFTGFVEGVRVTVDSLATFLQELLSQPAYGRPVPVIGWLGVVALLAAVAFRLAGLRVAVLAAAGFTSFGLLGLWTESMDTLALTLTAVLICVVIGVPLGVLLGLSPRVARVVNPVLDLTQTLPTFAYLAPLALLFLIGPATGVIATVIYAIAPVVRITSLGVAGANAAALESGRSLGATGWQLLRTVRLPAARRMIAVGINQTTMCALSMVTIAALIAAPGLGSTVLQSLRIHDTGGAFTAGLAIVIMAVVLDRITTGAIRRAERRTRPPRLAVIGVAVGAVVAVYLSYTFYWAALFPGDGSIGTALADGVNAATDWVRVNLVDITGAIKNAVTYGLINPLEALLAQSPWWLVCVAVLALTAILAGPRQLPIVAVCLGLVIATGLWEAAMTTLAATLIATALVLAVGVAFGVWLGRSDRADRALRPILDAAQVMPAFVYLVPCLALFDPSRFTGIIAAVVFAAPVTIKLIAAGIREVPPTIVEAATASGATAGQIIAKVQLPLAGRAVALAANQGLNYVLSMVVVGGLVGSGALGYLVVAGLVQNKVFGKGLAAGIAIVLLGLMLDRIAQATAARAARAPNQRRPIPSPSSTTQGDV
ncbi:ABC transporter permease subunit [Luedemannella flava]|uniref:ABC transporter permease subunit n=1 Tax=Luedemannella flava TaxID=349316 RepID=A0ABN2M423_9ACTN